MYDLLVPYISTIYHTRCVGPPYITVGDNIYVLCCSLGGILVFGGPLSGFQDPKSYPDPHFLLLLSSTDHPNVFWDIFIPL